MHRRAKEKLALESLDNVLYEFEELTSPSLYCAQRNHMNHKLSSGASISSRQPSVESVSRTHLDASMIQSHHLVEVGFSSLG